MKVRNTSLALGLAVLISVGNPSFAQTATLKSATPIAASAPTAVPSLIPYSGAILAVDGRFTAREAGVTFQIYKEETGGEALWTESQTVAVDSTGHYKVQLGATGPNGLPADLFSTGEARWLEVQIAGEAAQPRVLLASVPYALKASDAQTLGGLPASAFMLAGSKTSAFAAAAGAQNIVHDTNSNVTTPGGTTGYVPVFTGASTVADSILFSTATGIGVGDVPNSTAVFDVNGKSIWRGLLNVSRAGTATAAGGFDSYPLYFQGSSFNSSTHAAVLPSFQFQVEPTGNNTATPGATFNLLANSTSSNPVETGFYFNTNGTLHFAPGQTFPGAGDITGVTAGTALTGGGTSGTVTLNVDTTKVPLLSGNNAFTGNQTVTGTEKVTGSITGGTSLFLPNTSSATVGLVELGTTPFVSNYGFSGSRNAFFGGSGNFTTTGSYSVGVGAFTLLDQTSGSDNTAAGAYALEKNKSGSGNTAIGYAAGYDNGSTAINDSTAIGFFSAVDQSNSVVLGETTSGDPGNTFANVGIGTAAPVSALEVSVSVPGGVGPALSLTNGGGDTSSGNAASVIDFYTQPVATANGPGARIEALDAIGLSDDLIFSSKYPAGQFSFQQQNMIIYNGGQVVIGTNPDSSSSPNNAQLTVLQPYPGGQSGINTTGASSVNPGTGIVAIGGLNTQPTSGDPYGGVGGFFTGGDGDAGGISGDAIFAQTNPDSFQDAGGYAGVFVGDVFVEGTLFADVKDFKIDHPLDPADKYLVHTAVESSEMMNIYTGNVTTDELGIATVHLPEWFQAENGDFRYQLTVLGARFAQAVVSKEIEKNEFTISTNASNVKVSWQVTAIRQDAYAKAHPLAVEQAKNEHERGYYMHPELYGQPQDKQTEWGRHSQLMKQLKVQQEQSKLASKSALKPVHPRSIAPATAVNRKSAHKPLADLKPIAAVK